MCPSRYVLAQDAACKGKGKTSADLIASTLTVLLSCVSTGFDRLLAAEYGA
jgi:hypothetical protein